MCETDIIQLVTLDLMAIVGASSSPALTYFTCTHCQGAQKCPVAEARLVDKYKGLVFLTLMITLFLQFMMVTWSGKVEGREVGG